MHIVWHIAAMGNWQEVVREQLALLHQVQLLNVDCTFVGTGLDWLLPECQRHGVRVGIVRSDPNLMHYETFAMLHIERLVQLSAEPMLYFHTKGVSEITDPGKMPWRRLMENALIRNWRASLTMMPWGSIGSRPIGSTATDRISAAISGWRGPRGCGSCLLSSPITSRGTSCVSRARLGSARSADAVSRA